VLVVDPRCFVEGNQCRIIFQSSQPGLSDMPIMKMLSRIAFAACVVSALAVSAVAQGPGGRGGAGGGRMGMGMGMGMGGGASGLLMMKEVREELKLDDDQVKELEEMGKAMQESMQSMRPQPGQQPDPAAMQANMEKIRKAMAESEAKLEEILDPKQMDRLVGLVIQRDSLRAINSKLVAAKLGITDEQKAKMADVEKESQEKMRELFQGGFSPEMRDKMREMREESDNKLKAILTDKQKTDMEALKGAEFKFPEPQWGRGGQGGPGGQGGRGNRRPGGDGV
jgi:Spy/CpxP family protein refolding chaperone